MLFEDLPWNCSCGAAHVARSYKSMGLYEQPEHRMLLRSVFEGQHNVFVCDRCGQRAVIDRDLLVIDHVAKWAVYALNRDEDQAAMQSELPRSLAGYRTRIVRDRVDLVERVRMLVGGVDDVAIEVLRLFLRSGPDAGAYRFMFERMDEERIYFVVLDGRRPVGTQQSQTAAYQSVRARFDTAKHAMGPWVDQQLARELVLPGR
ncbi:MAG: CpXC domain-containing protein [Polyangiales bacterium]